MKSFAPALILLLSTNLIFTQTRPAELSPKAKEVLDRKFPSWRLADITPVITGYYKSDRPHESPNLIKGDWNGDRQTDYAVMLQKNSDPEKHITVAFIRAGKTYETYILGANDCIMSVKRGQRDYNFDTGKHFRYKNDAIFDYIWEKAGSSYVWENRRFRRITTSD